MLNDQGQSQAEIATELRLGLPGDFQSDNRHEKKRLFWEIINDEVTNGSSSSWKIDVPVKNHVVGWPPVCSYRKRVIGSCKGKGQADGTKVYIKVSMDGVICLRKVELSVQGGYSELVLALEKLFGCTGIGGAEASQETSSEYMLIYEDKDGDWMLVGDVPWEMFMGSCKRLRIMKRSEAKDMDLPTTPPQ